MYESLIKPLLFLFDPELMHDFFVALGEMLGSLPGGQQLVGSVCRYEHPMLETRVLGVDFKNPIGLAAGFDKDVRLTKIVPSVGFGFMEVGSVTRFPYGGNRGRRLVGLPARPADHCLLWSQKYRRGGRQGEIAASSTVRDAGGSQYRENKPRGHKRRTFRGGLREDVSADRAVFFVRYLEHLLPQRPGWQIVPGSAPFGRPPRGVPQRRKT